MGTNDIPVNDVNHPEGPEPTDSSPVSSFTNILVLTNSGLFHIYYSVIGPIAEDPQYRIPLRTRQAEIELDKITDKIKLLKEALR